MPNLDIFLELAIEPIAIVTKGLAGLLIAVGAYALYAWSIYLVVTKVPPAALGLLDAFEAELSQVQYMSGPKYHVYSDMLRFVLPMLIIAIAWLAMGVFISFIPDPTTLL